MSQSALSGVCPAAAIFRKWRAAGVVADLTVFEGQSHD